MGIPTYTVNSTEVSHELLKGISIINNPILPTFQQWVESSIQIPEGDEKYLKKAPNGLYYSIKGGQLYVPPVLRERVLHFFHAGRYGGHHGVSKTTRKLYLWFYWPKLKHEVSEYIKGCLACKRVRAPGSKYLKAVLEKPEPFQLVSMDFVGPRKWKKEKLNYVVIVDHFSRFLIVRKVKDVTSETIIRSFIKFWLPYFGVPHVLLVDRGPVFVSTKFQEFVTKELGAELLFSGPAYPQGNSLNESAHKGLEASILARRQYDPEVDFKELLEDVSLAYNSTPHSMTGSSPFYMPYGKEMILPGLVSFSATVSEAQRTTRQEDIKIQTIRRAILAKDNNFHIYKKEDFSIGDLVVYKLQLYEKREKETDEDYTLVKYGPEWSLPVRIKDWGINTVTVVTESGRDLVLPKRLVRKTGTNLLDSLQQLASTIIQTEITQQKKRGRLIQLPDDTKKRRVLLA